MRGPRFALTALATALLVTGTPALLVAEAPVASASTTSSTTTDGASAPASAGAAPSQQCTAGQVAWISQRPSALGLLQSDLAWSVTTGSGVLVAVVDSGVDAGNAHLTGALAGGIDLVGDGAGANGYADASGHGTAVAGIIAARQVADSGVIGLAPGARILSVRAFSSDTEQALKAGLGPTPARIALGIRRAADAGAQIVNVSLSTDVDNPELRSAVAYASGRGALVVASAGNRASATSKADGLRYPAADPGALSVTAVTADGAATNDSVHGPHVQIAAPGQHVLTSADRAGDCQYADSAAESSFATAYVAAAAALVAAAHPDETPAEWAYRLEATATRADPDRRDDTVGWGIVQPYDALTLAPGPAIRGPVDPLTGTSPTPIAAEPGRVHLTATASPWGTSRITAADAGLLGLTALGVLTPLLVLRRRRQVLALTTRQVLGVALFDGFGVVVGDGGWGWGCPRPGCGRGRWSSSGRGGRQWWRRCYSVFSVIADWAAVRSTMDLLVAKVAMRALTARLFTARG